MNELTAEQLEELQLIAERLCRQSQFSVLDPDDVAQEAAIRILSNPWEYRWRHVHQAAVDLVRKDESSTVPVGLGLDRPTPYEDRDMFMDVGNALAKLSTQQRQVAVLYGMHGWPLDAVASRLNTSRATVHRRWSEARINLARELAQYRETE